MPRRTLLSRGLAGAGLLTLASGGLVTLVDGTPVRAAAQPVVLTFLPWGGWPAYAGPHWPTFIKPAMQHFEAANPGIRIKVGTPQGGNTAILSAILAGVGPDVFQDWVMSPYLEASAALDLKPYIQQDNIPLSTWSPGQMRTMTTETGIWALPTYVHVDAYAINLTNLDALGLPYPSPDWTYQDAEKLFRATSFKKGNTQYYGVKTAYTCTSIGEFAYPCHQWGGAVRDATRTKCTVDQPQAYTGLQWYQTLYWDKLATASGTIVQNVTFMEIGSNWVPTQLNTFRNNVKWTYWWAPRFPAGQAQFEADDFYMASAATKNRDAAWLFMKFLTSDPWWQRYNMQYLLRTPGMVSMWDEWVRQVETTAPVSRGKHLSVFKDAAATWGVAPRYFKYNDTAVEPILTNAVADAFNHKGDLVTLLGVAAKQITAQETAAAAAAGAGAVQSAKMNALIAQATRAGGAGSYGAPPVSGLGTAALAAAKGAVTRKGGVWTIQGTGTGLKGTGDGLTFACAPWTKAKGTFTCRLVSIQSVAGGPIQNGCKIGLMARGELTTEAVDASVEAAMGRGVHAESRPVQASSMGDQRAGATPGLLQAAGLLHNPANKHANYLVKPLWLRLVQDVNHWSAYTSLDGHTWLQAGLTMGIEAVSVWVGIFVAPNDADTAHHVQASFDNLSFTPTQSYQIG